MGRGRELKKFRNKDNMPDLLIIGGVNGAGKSTIFPSIQNTEQIQGSFQPGKIENENFVNADDIDRSMGADK
jgi:predicted ABC-type ATPase